MYAAITKSDKEWLAAEYDSPELVQLRKKYREIEEKIEDLEVGEERSQLVTELFPY
ncbi:MAG: hypothetical protein U5O39_20040 [Gammaproteobacteria bacterium]|nr:hypothetical protein [Gammaproteobacteria bacterium]